MSNDIKEYNDKILILRKKIDEVDEVLLKLFSKRFQIVSAVGELKKEFSVPVLQKNRFDEILKKLEEKSNKFDLKISKNFIDEIWNRIHDEALKIEK